MKLLLGQIDIMATAVARGIVLSATNCSSHTLESCTPATSYSLLYVHNICAEMVE